MNTSVTGDLTKTPAVFRFAPSPTGELHVGHALSALVGRRWADRLGGRFLLRIEDIDTTRTRAHFIDQIIDDLTWLGLTWDGPILHQSLRLDAHADAVSRLDAMGLLYPCFATRKEIAAASKPGDLLDPDGAPIYPALHKSMAPDERARRKAAGQSFALRLDMDRAVDAARTLLKGAAITYHAIELDGTVADVQARPERWGDAVLVRKDIPSSYHLAVVVDDAAQAITHVTRGRDLEAATDIHRLLQVLLDLPAPLYHHHRLILDADGAKLSKSNRAPSIRDLRRQGATPRDVLAIIGPV